MKRISAQILLGLLVASGARADTDLPINGTPPSSSCFSGLYPLLLQNSMSRSFSLNGVPGTATFQSAVSTPTVTSSYYFPNASGTYFYEYSIDLSQLPQSSNCVGPVIIHFGTPLGCGSAQVFADVSNFLIENAILEPFGDVVIYPTLNNCWFTGGGEPVVNFTMISHAPPKIGTVTIVYQSQLIGSAKVTINVPAIVPDIPPNPPIYNPGNIQGKVVPKSMFQGRLSNVATNQATLCTNCFPSGSYDFTLQLLDSVSNGVAASLVITQTVQVASGLFNMPLPFDPISMADGSASWLSLGVRPSGVATAPFTPINPPLPITPASQALYAYTAGTVADLGPGQAVTSLNGLTDAVNLQGGNSIFLVTNGNTLTISAVAGSDRNIKTDFTRLNPEEILAKLAGLPIQGWRYTNEVAGVRHVGPMAQDFKTAFGLGKDEKFIEFVDAQGVALAAIQGLNQKMGDQLKAKDAEIKQLQQNVAELRAMFDQISHSQTH